MVRTRSIYVFPQSDFGASHHIVRGESYNTALLRDCELKPNLQQSFIYLLQIAKQNQCRAIW